MFPQRRGISAQEAREKTLNIISHQGNADQNRSETPLQTLWGGKNQKDRRYQGCGMQGLELLYSEGLLSGAVAWEISLVVAQMV